MKRFKIAIFIVLTLVAVTIISHITVMNYTLTMLESIEDVKNSVQNQEFDKAQNQIKYLSDFTKANEHLLALFLKRDYVGAIITSISTFKAYAIAGSEPDLFAELDRAKNQIMVTHHLFFSII